MSDLSMYEVEDIAWEEFCQSEDHIVPHPGVDRGDDSSIKGEICKKTRCEATIPNSCGDRSLRYASQGNEQRGFSTLSKMRKMILEQDSWSPSPNGAIPAPSDNYSVKEVSSLASENTKTPGYRNNNADSNGSEICENDNLLGDKNAAGDSNSFSYPLGDISQTSNSIVFFENSEEKDPSNFLYYGWPEIGNFEDVDKMFGNCNSTFGLGSSKEDDVDWLSLSDDLGASAIMLRTDFKFSHPEADEVKDISINNDSKKRFAIGDDKDENIPKEHISEMRLKGKFQPKHLANSHSRTGNDRMINENKKQTKLQNQFEGRRKRQFCGNASFNYVSNWSNEVVQVPEDISHPLFPPVHNQQHRQTLGPDFYNCSQNSISFVCSGNGILSDQTSAEPAPSSIKSETKDIMYPSQKGSSQASSQFQFLEGSPPFYVPSNEGSEIKERHHDLQGIGSSNVPECSTISSGVDDISLEAAILRQLQFVTKQLDLRTKLCIRDSLYRLARSAEQRHINQNGGCGERDTSGAFKARGTKFPGFMDLETDTNPIDRSIAHLLFHRPPETSALPAQDPWPLKSPRMVHNSVDSPTVVVDELAVHEETLAEREKQN